MAKDLEIHLPWMRYDITLPLMEGRVAIDGVRFILDPPAPSGTLFGSTSHLKSGDFDLVDINMANWLPAIEAGWELVGLPIFTKRKHLYTYIFCRADAGIETPKDLEGKRVLSTISSSAATIWLKILLERRHGVDLSTVTWIAPKEQWPVFSSCWKVERLERRKSVVDMLLNGDAEASMVDISDRRLYDVLEHDPRVKRLFPNYLAEARQLYEEDRLYPPIQMIVMSRRLDWTFPDLAGKLLNAFNAARQLAYEDVLDDRSGFCLVDLRERFAAQYRDWGDLFPHGIVANRGTIDTFMSYSRKYGIVTNDLTYEQVFAASALETTKADAWL